MEHCDIFDFIVVGGGIAGISAIEQVSGEGPISFKHNQIVYWFSCFFVLLFLRFAFEYLNLVSYY